MAASPIWIIVGMIAMAIILVSMYLAKKAPATSTTPGAAPSPVPRRRSWNYTGIAGIIVLVALVIMIYSWADDGLNEVSDVAYYGSGFNVTKGAHKVTNNVLYIKGPWELTIPAGKAISLLKIQPNDGFHNLSKNLTVWTGEGKNQHVYRFYHGNQTCSEVSNLKEDIYKGEIFYGGVSNYGCLYENNAVRAASYKQEQEPLKIGIRWYCPFVTGGSCKIPGMFVGTEEIAYPINDKEEAFGAGGDIHILSDIDAEIMWIQVKYTKI
jgi:hypothetical protein